MWQFCHVIYRLSLPFTHCLYRPHRWLYGFVHFHRWLVWQVKSLIRLHFSAIWSESLLVTNSSEIWNHMIWLISISPNSREFGRNSWRQSSGRLISANIDLHLAVAGDVFDGVFLCCPFFPKRCLGWDLRLNWVRFWGFSFLLLYQQNLFWASP